MVTLFPFTSATPFNDDISQPTIEITSDVISHIFILFLLMFYSTRANGL